MVKNAKDAEGKPPEEESASRQARRQKAAADIQAYIDKHQLVHFVQNLMQSVLADKPENPFEYMERHVHGLAGSSSQKAEALPITVGGEGGGPSTKPMVRMPSALAERKIAVPTREGLLPFSGKKDFSGTGLIIQDSEGEISAMRPVLKEDLCAADCKFQRLKVPHLSEIFGSKSFGNPVCDTAGLRTEAEWVAQNLNVRAPPRVHFQMMLAQPRAELHFLPKETIAAIVACDGLSPGLNVAIRELVDLLFMHGVTKIYGIPGGFQGVLHTDAWVELTPQKVQDIHMIGGTVLQCDRGCPPAEEQAQHLRSMGVRQCFVLGGESAHSGALATASALMEMKWECSVVAIPKSIDNDIPLVDETLGYDTACTEAKRAIDTAYIEATCNSNCIGLVKLMGRSSGYISLTACLAARNVDVCLLPEMNIDFDKVLAHIVNLMRTKKYAVVVVAAGVGEQVFGDTDKSGSGGKASTDIGLWLEQKIVDKFSELRLPVTIKYIDPTYMIRAVQQNSYDSVYGTVLAQNAVHAAMAGYTAATVGKVLQRYVVLPLRAVTAMPTKIIDVQGMWFQRLILSTLQPSFAPDNGPAGFTLSAGNKVSESDLEAASEEIGMEALLSEADEVRRLCLEHLGDKHGSKEGKANGSTETPFCSDGLVYFQHDSWVTGALLPSKTESGAPGSVCLQMLRAGPRKTLYFEPQEVVAAIVTCGGLCPGLNSVIREVVMMLYAYGVRKVYGIKGGYKGVVATHTWVTLTPDNVRDIHMAGGTILVADRGNPTEEEMAKALEKKGVRQYFVIGGDGTHRGAMQTYRAMQQTGWECAVVGIPKTIDNDIALLDRTFGFNTACTEAKKAIDTAYVEATCNANCIGLVKLMGRHCGYITMMACIAAQHADICLLPEMHITLESVLEYAATLLKTQGHAVIVVAEGCGDTMIQSSGETDAGGNKKLADVGLWLKEALMNHFKSLKLPLTIKYVDPTYMVRAVPANANDSVYCSTLAQGAVHGAMAGYTGITVAKVDEKFVYLPIRTITETPNRKVDVGGPWFQRLVDSTKQPNLGVVGLSSAKPRDPNRVTIQQLPTSFLQDEVRVPETKLTVIDGYGKVTTSRALMRDDLLEASAELRCFELFHLGDRYGKQEIVSPLKSATFGGTTRFQDNFSWSTQALCTREASSGCGKSVLYYQMTRAGPREYLHFDPYDPTACAAIVSCGGICPGLNSVIREVVNTLWAYGVRKIFGIKGGFKGVVENEAWFKLSPEVVQDIHNQGGTILVSDRGNPSHLDMAKALKARNVRQYFVLGGDGTHQGAMSTFEACLEVDHECAVVGVPKTIDNDVPLLDQTFGFDTACTEAMKAVESAYVEATCNANCIGLVKLMGRHCGYITLNACLAEGRVDICLLPEMSIDLQKVLDYTVHLMKTKGHAVIVVAEGCGDTMITGSGETDAGGNKKLGDIGGFVKGEITKHFKQLSLPLTIKFIDPTYMIRSTKPSSFDSVYCAILAQNAVHGAMAGYSGMTVGRISERIVYLPIHAITKQAGKRVDVKGSWFRRLRHSTKQPGFALGDEESQGSHEQDSAEKCRTLSLPVSVNTILQVGDEVRRLELVNLSSIFKSAGIANPLRQTGEDMLDEKAWALQSICQYNKRDNTGHSYFQMLRAGPRATLHFEPSTCAAVIVTCGGLCPGLNSVIREIVMMLKQYGVPNVYGCRGGYKGMVAPDNWMVLDEQTVQDIHLQGGTILVSDRGNPPHSEIAQVLKEKKITQYFILGGDGTHKGAMQTFQEMQKIGHECAVVGVPKTIDNDVPMIDRSFGFNTACSEAVKAIDSAYVEATCNANCIGLVKLMGRHCGFIAQEATLAARHVDIVMLPEMEVSLPKVLKHCWHLMNTKGYAVVVVAEGCGDTLIQSSGETDAGGNKMLADVGPWLKDQILAFFKKMQKPLTIKYIDPTYMIRAVPANSNDSIYCTVLGQYAVHGAMSGYTGITVGKVDNSFVMLPIHAITEVQPRRVNLKNRQFERLLHTTLQPDLSPGPGDDWALLPPAPAPTASAPNAKSETPPEVDTLQWMGIGERPDKEATQLEEMKPGICLKVFDGFGNLDSQRDLTRADVMKSSDSIRRLEVMRLSKKFPSKNVITPLKDFTVEFQDDNSWAAQACKSEGRADQRATPYYQMLEAGPREYLHFDPKDSNSCAAIITCGGLCPGLNAVIREVTMMLFAYGVERVYGIRGGYKGIIDRESWMELKPDMVYDIHMQGGTILVSDRGNPSTEDMAKALVEHNVRQFFVLGGDGTHRGALQIFTALLDLNHECAVVGVPKTIDNDVPIVDQTFGFDTACTEARRAIDAAYVEATCNANCIGFVKLMGRHSGFVALNAVLAARHVDICLLPEMDTSLEKVLEHCEWLMSTKGYAVVVVAEGCGDTMIKGSGGTDAGGNKLLADAGVWLKEQIITRFKEKKKPLTIKYIDPTYMVRSVEANAFDSVYCAVLAQHAVHGAMAGFTGITVAKVYERYVYLPIHAITRTPGKRVNRWGRWFARMQISTQQPNFEPDGYARPQADGNAGKVLMSVSTPLSINDVLSSADEVHRYDVVNLGSKFASKQLDTSLLNLMEPSLLRDSAAWSSETFGKGRCSSSGGRTYRLMMLSGARRIMHFDPKEEGSCAAIVTCGGLCPGLNNVIREIVNTLKQYGVDTVHGIIGGYKGCTKDDEWRTLTPDHVQDIHQQGGSVIVSDRGNPPPSDIAQVLAKRKVRQFFVLGGDGTHRGAMDCFLAMDALGHECAVVGVPKTIDNDIPLLDHSFGFDTACTEAEKAIDAAYVEATTNANCIGLVRLMGRHCGFIALYACLAARHVDICLLPEMEISKPKLLDYVADVMRRKKYAVIVVAEGCGDTILKGDGSTDAGGNKTLADVGPYLKDEITSHLKSLKIPVSIKYIDPTYMVRSVAANATDSVYTSLLAQHAVHAAMAGYTGCTVGRVDGRYVTLPIHAITSQGSRKVDVKGRMFERLMMTTRQPSFAA